MTLAQLRSFATVARLGSVSAAARDAGRQRAGGVRGGRGAAPRPRRRAVRARRRRAPADAGRRAPGRRRGGDPRARGPAAARGARGARRARAAAARRRPAVAEYVVRAAARRVHAPLADARGGPGGARRRRTSPRCSPTAAPTSRSGRRPHRRRGIETVAVPALPARGRRRAAPSAGRARATCRSRRCGRERWLVGPGATPTLDRLLRRARRSAPPSCGAFATEAAAPAAAAAGEGVMLAIAHTVLDALRRAARSSRLDVRGTPARGPVARVDARADRRSPVADALRRFVTTPDATQAIVARPGRRAGGPLPPAGLRHDLERGRGGLSGVSPAYRRRSPRRGPATARASARPAARPPATVPRTPRRRPSPRRRRSTSRRP